MARHTISRRTLLQGSALLSLPLLNCFQPARALTGTQVSPPKRLFIVFNGLGTIRNEWYSGAARNYSLKRILQPLESQRSRLTIIRGLTHTSTNNTHEATELAALTGQPYNGDRKTTKNADGISIDQHIANHIGQTTPIHSMVMSVQGKNQYNPISHKGRNSPNFPLRNPYDAFDQYLGQFDGEQSTPQSRAEKLAAQRRIVLRETHERYTAIYSALGQDDRHRMEQHLDYLADLVNQLDFMEQNTGEQSNSCSILAPSSAIHSQLPPRTANQTTFSKNQDAFFELYNMSENTLNRIDDVVKTYMDTCVQAFNCDISRVAVLDHGHYHGHGSQSHQADPNNRNSDPDSWDKILDSGIKTARNIRYLVDKLSSIQESDGSTLMDNTLIYWLYSHADGFRHDRTDCVDVLIGNAGGMFTMDRVITLDKFEKRPHNELLASIGHCFGLTDEGFGKEAWRGRGQLSELGVMGFS